MENQKTAANEAPARRVSESLRDGARQLVSRGIESAALDAEILLGHVLGLSREQILVAGNALLDGAQSCAFERLLSRRAGREPIAYITGKREFWSLDFRVSRAVLIPRPETELLVAVALRLAEESAPGRTLRAIDLGTGSGAVAVALASEAANVKIFATDVSAEALRIARDNAMRNGVAGRMEFVQGDLFDPIQRKKPVDLIVSNPPYIRRSDIDRLAPEVSRWEPRGALDGGCDGLDYYRRIAAEEFHFLGPKRAVAEEIGSGTGRVVAAIFQDARECAAVSIHNDYAHSERVVVARKVAARATAI